MEHLCTLHDTEFFKHSKGDKVWYSHPIQENGEDVKGRNGKTLWCNEDIKEAVDALPPQKPGILPEHQKEIDKARASVRPTKDLAVCLSYAKDLAIAGEIKLCDIFVWAEALYTFISGNMGVGDEQVAELIMKLLRENSSETNKTDNKTTAYDEVSKDEGTQTVLGESGRELTLNEVKELLIKNGKDMNEWAKEVAKCFEFDMTGKTVRQLWESLDKGKKGLAIGGLK